MATTLTSSESFPLPSFEDRLWEELAHLHVDVTTQEPGYGPDVPDVRPPGRGSRRRRYVAGAGALAAAACLVAVALVVDQGEPRATTESAAAADPHPDDMVVVSETRSPGEAQGGVATIWRDETTGASRSLNRGGGHPDDAAEVAVTVDVAEDGAETVTFREVNHRRREYWEHVGPGAAERLQPGQSGELFRRMVDEGSFIPDGREVVDGVELLRFVGRPPVPELGCALDRGLPPSSDQVAPQPVQPEICNLISTATMIVWAEPATLRKVKEVSGLEDGDDGLTTTFTYLPRTEENLALLELDVPDGYQQVPAPTGAR